MRAHLRRRPRQRRDRARCVAVAGVVKHDVVGPPIAEIGRRTHFDREAGVNGKRCAGRNTQERQRQQGQETAHNVSVLLLAVHPRFVPAPMVAATARACLTSCTGTRERRRVLHARAAVARLPAPEYRGAFAQHETGIVPDHLDRPRSGLRELALTWERKASARDRAEAALLVAERRIRVKRYRFGLLAIEAAAGIVAVGLVLRALQYLPAQDGSQVLEQILFRAFSMLSVIRATSASDFCFSVAPGISSAWRPPAPCSASTRRIAACVFPLLWSAWLAP